MSDKFILIKGDLGDNKINTCVEWAKQHRYEYAIFNAWDKELPKTELLIINSAEMLNNKKIKAILKGEFKKVFFLTNHGCDIKFFGFTPYVFDNRLRKITSKTLYQSLA